MRIKINMSFILFLFISLYLGYCEHVLIIFFSVLFHELGHGIAARYLRISIMEIQLFPFGGIVIMENIAKYGGYKELIVALMGPMISMMIALLFLVFRNVFNFSQLIFKYNAALFLFNLIPALPLDGGRIVRNILLSHISYKRATKLMTYGGKLLAIFLILINIYFIVKGQQTVAYITAAIFIFVGAIKEEKNCSYIYLLNRNNKKEAMIGERGFSIRVLNASKETYLKSIADQFSPGNICKIRIYDEKGVFIDELCEADIMNGFLMSGYYSKIKDIL